VIAQVFNYTITMKNRTAFLVAVAACLVGLEILVWYIHVHGFIL